MAPTARRRLLERLWVALTVGYGAARAVVVALTLGRYGVNPWIYGVIDVATSFPLGLATARAVGAAVDREWSALRRWSTIAAAAFIAPDLSIVAMGRAMPVIVYVVLAAIVTATATSSLVSAVRKVRAGRRKRDDVASVADGATRPRVDAS